MENLKVVSVNRSKRNKYSMQEYVETDRQLHWLSQVIAQVNRAYAPAQADDSHTNLYFDTLGDQLMGRWIATPSGKWMLTLNLAGLHFEWLNERFEVMQSIAALSGNGWNVRKEIAKFLAARGLDTTRFFEPMHFEIPDYGFQDAPVQISEDGLKQWKHYRKLANTAGASFLGFLQVAGEARIWPHHFDTGVYAAVSEQFGVGFGLAMKDGLVDQPYFYLAGYPGPGLRIDYDHRPTLTEGRWEISDRWKGAVLPLDELPLFCDESEQKVYQFMREALIWLLAEIRQV